MSKKTKKPDCRSYVETTTRTTERAYKDGGTETTIEVKKSVTKCPGDGPDPKTKPTPKPTPKSVAYNEGSSWGVEDSNSWGLVEDSTSWAQSSWGVEDSNSWGLVEDSTSWAQSSWGTADEVFSQPPELSSLPPACVEGTVEFCV